METINPKKYNTTFAELNNYSSTFRLNCRTEYQGFLLKPCFVLNVLSPRHYFDVYAELGRFARSKLPAIDLVEAAPQPVDDLLTDDDY